MAKRRRLRLGQRCRIILNSGDRDDDDTGSAMETRLIKINLLGICLTELYRMKGYPRFKNRGQLLMVLGSGRLHWPYSNAYVGGMYGLSSVASSSLGIKIYRMADCKDSSNSSGVFGTALHYHLKKIAT